MKEIIKLSTPIQTNGTEECSLEMREPTVNDILAVQKATQVTMEQEVELCANLCQIAPDSIRSLTFKDYRKLQKTLSKMMGDEIPLE